MKSVICFGEALIDFQPVLPCDPSQPQTFQRHAGGAPANVAVAVASLCGKAEFIGTLANDPFGDYLQDSLIRFGVGTSHVQRTSAAPTALAFVSLDENGERSFSFYRSPAADLLFRESRLSASAFEEAAILHACSNSLTEEGIAQTTLTCMRRARDAGVLVSFDMNLRAALWPPEIDPSPRIRSALALADVVKLSVEELAFVAAAIGSESATFDELWAGNTKLLLVTDGARPLRWYTPDAHGSHGTYSVQMIDSTAAGDAFSGGLLISLAEHAVNPSNLAALTADSERFKQVLSFSSACGALATTRRGAFEAMPCRAEVDTLMNSSAPVQPEVALP
jgi:fructokinase